MIMTVAGDDANFLGWSLLGQDIDDWGDEQRQALRWLSLYVYRILDIGSKLLLYALFYHLKGELAFVLLLFNVCLGGFVYAMLKKIKDGKEPPTTALLLPAVTPLNLNGYSDPR